MPDAAFLSLARRLGNPIADRPDAVGLLELLILTRTVRADSTWRRVQLTALAWIRRLQAPVGVSLMSQ
jgi:hypothetical protein